MPKVPVASAREVIKALESIDFYVARQSGSHIIMRRDEPFTQTVVPNHREIREGTMKAIIKDTGLSVEEFTKILKGM